jgi:ABC-type lipoprotein release transport system permease subunit
MIFDHVKFALRSLRSNPAYSVAALFFGLWPARRAASIDPALTLRAD